MVGKHPRSPDTTNTGRNRPHIANSGSAVPTYNTSLDVGGEQCLITDPLVYSKGAGSEKPQPYPTRCGSEQVFIRQVQDSEHTQAATELVLTGMDVDDVESPEGAEDVVLRLIGNLISENEGIPGAEQPQHDVEVKAAEPPETSHDAQTSWTITVNGDLTTRKTSVALEGVPTASIPAVLRLVEALSTLLVSSSAIPVPISSTTCGVPRTRVSSDLNSIRGNLNKATPIIGTRANRLIPAASPDTPFTDAEIRTEINRICAEAGEGIPNRARKEEIKKQYLEGTIKVFGMVAQLKRRGEPCRACATAGQECSVLDKQRERVLTAVRCVRCIAGKRKCEDA